MKKHLKRMAMMVVVVVALVTIVGMTTNFSEDDLYLRDNMVIVENIGKRGFVKSMGSGFLYMDGHIMTAGHVTKGATSLKITYVDKTTETVKKWVSSRYDISTFHVKRKCKQGVIWDTRNLEVGTVIYTQGHPFGIPELRLSKGIVSSVEIDTGMWSVGIIVDADAEVGNSGGPLITSTGRVAGLVVGKWGGLVLCIPGRLLHDFVLNPRGKDHKKSKGSEVNKKIRQGFLPLYVRQF